MRNFQILLEKGHELEIENPATLRLLNEFIAARLDYVQQVLEASWHQISFCLANEIIASKLLSWMEWLHCRRPGEGKSRKGGAEEKRVSAILTSPRITNHLTGISSWYSQPHFLLWWNEFRNRVLWISWGPVRQDINAIMFLMCRIILSTLRKIWPAYIIQHVTCRYAERWPHALPTPCGLSLYLELLLGITEASFWALQKPPRGTYCYPSVRH